MQLLKLLLFISPLIIEAQLPETDIWLFDLSFQKGTVTVKKGSNITNRVGYDNQPHFSLDDNHIVYVSIREDKQADIYKYVIDKNTTEQLTKTSISEYSPNYCLNGKYISCVVVEADSAQRIWLYNLDGTINKVLSESTDSVGYYTWLTNDSLLYYKLTEPHSLKALEIKSNNDVWLADNITRAFKPIQGSDKFIYGIKENTKTIYRTYSPTLRKNELYTTIDDVCEDFIWHPSYGLVVSKNAKLLQFNKSTSTWQTLIDLESFGIKKITRFNFDSKNKRLAVVSNL